MKCQVCGANTEIRETRDTNMRYRRRRKCTNGHYFTTEEVIVSPYQIEQERQERFEETRNKRLESIRASKPPRASNTTPTSNKEPEPATI